jgi:hypothetical protein
MSDELPRRRWELSAPESQMLLWGPETGDAWVVKLAIMELVVRRVLRLVSVPDRRLLFFSKRTTVLVPALRLDDAAGRALTAVVVAFPKTRTYPDGTAGVSVERAARAVFSHYLKSGSVQVQGLTWSWSSGGYGKAVVLPALEQRRLYRREQSSRLGLFPSTTWVLTAEGLAALEELRRIMAIGRGHFAGWVKADPARARSFVDLAGPALLLQGGLTPLLRQLQQWAATHGEKPPKPTGLGGGFRSDAEQGRVPVAGPVFGLAVLAGVFGPGPLDGLDAAFYAIADDVDRAWNAILGSGSGGE